MYLEGGGGGNQHESYDLSAYFYLNSVDLINPQFPFFFVTGDEGYWETESDTEIKNLFGKGTKEKKVTSKENWRKLMKKYIKKPFYHSGHESSIIKQWTETLGEERVLQIQHPKACIDVMLGAIALTSGARDLEGYIKDMKVRGQDEERIKEVVGALRLYNEKLKRNEVDLIKYKANILPQSENNISNIPTVQTNNFSINQDELFEIQQACEKLTLEESDEDGLAYINSLKNVRSQLGDSVPALYLCPLTKEFLFDPVMTSDGLSFERKAIEYWLDKYDVSPVNGIALDSKSLLPNFALKQLIREYHDMNLK
jgi:hypothetical protein